MKKILLLIAISLLFPFQSHASILGVATTNDLKKIEVQIELIRYRIEMLANQIATLGQTTVIERIEDKFGADTTLPIAGTVYTLSGSGISSSATTIGLTSLTIPQTGYEILDADVSDTFYLTVEPGSRTRQEVVSCTTVTQNADNTATLTGCSRGLLPISPYTASSTYRFAHAGGTSVVFSNPPQLYNEFAGKTNDETISGTWTYASTNIPRQDSYLAPTLNTQFAPKKYVDDTAIAGAPIATESIAGISILATQAQTAAGTATSSSYSLIPQNRYFNATSSATTTVPVTKTNGKLSQGFLDLTEGFTFSGGATSSATTTISGPLTISSTSTVSGNLLASGSANTMATTTFSGTQTFNGNLSFATSTTAYTNAVLWQYLGASSTATTASSSEATAAIVNMFGVHSGSPSETGGQVTIFKTGLTSATLYFAENNGITDTSQTASWSGNTITLSKSDGSSGTYTINAGSTIYWFK